MELTPDPGHELLRAELRAWLGANLPATPLASLDTAAGFAAHRDWERRLFAAGWAVVSWPREYGGRGLDLLGWLAVEEEYWAAGAPARVSQNGIFLLAPTLFEYGTAAQRDRFLVPMARADQVWAQGWSEPQAGSDLAALRTRARRVDGGWRVSGHKTWSSRAAFADWMFALVRTDPASERHHGLSYLLLALSADGVTVRPIRQLDGEPGFAEVFLDDVFVPDHQVLGPVGGGWRVAMSTTGSERGLTLRSPGRFLAAAERLRRLWCAQPPGPVDAAVVAAWLDADAYRLYVLDSALRLASGESLGATSSANKVFWSELDLAIHDAALRLLGDAAPAAGDWLDGYQFALAGPIYAGTNEVQRNLLAERVLGLPKG